MAAPTNQGIITEAGLFIITESGNYLVTEAFTTQGGGKAKPKEIKEDNRILNNQLEHHLKIKEKMHYTI